MDLPFTAEQISSMICSTTGTVFQTMLGMTPVAGNPGAATHDCPSGGVASLVGFTGQWNGSGIIRCSGGLACNITGKMLMSTFTHVDDEVLDAMGEIANMVVGNFKEEVSPLLGPIRLSTPTVIHGSDFHTRNLAHKWFTVNFDCEGESMEVSVCLVPA
jgi:chemotaxis protein CheX